MEKVCRWCREYDKGICNKQSVDFSDTFSSIVEEGVLESLIKSTLEKGELKRLIDSLNIWVMCLNISGKKKSEFTNLLNGKFYSYTKEAASLVSNEVHELYVNHCCNEAEIIIDNPYTHSCSEWR